VRAGFIALVLSAIAACSNVATPKPVAMGEIAGSDPVLRLVSGRELRAELARVDADVVLLNVWATWCAPCREEFPDLLRLRGEYRDRGVVVEFLSGDFPSHAADVSAFLRELAVDFPSYIKAGKDMELIEALHPDWSGALPATFIFGRGGEVLQWWEGAASYGTFAAAVDAALARTRSLQ
jgi:thiol-disulfide isomerase/thioredoxin